ncbi:DUF4037 domain-containing protein [Bifidobacterium callitrichidarum]|uniref:DUF4037 domain-containing protein n=1 Tax=Bifidobacterium callitrichidarum TaxID=2052941 RepID=A0A2U2NBV9_9BIFI|nr:DUF4037 domain-containing protein [Bifidobacterium callitrichidarum]PWG66570.1 hypothetical protein DF196_02865 [Bifidobacterium callitrichidarum]
MVDEDALLRQFAAQFAHGPEDGDDTDEVAAAQSAIDDDENGETPADFDVDDFLKGLDDIFNRHAASTEAGPYLEQAAVDAENAGDAAGLLTVLNETMGFYRSQGRHKENQWIVQRALELAARMGLTTGTSEAWATTLINCATAMRAAKQYDQAKDLYHQAQDVCQRAFSPTDRRLAALHNNLSMLYSETDRLDKAETELREALRIIEASSVNPDADIDVASSHTNLALTLLAERKLEGAHWHAAKALEIYKTGHLEHSAHFASALAGFAQVCFAEKRYADAVDGYRRALKVIEECYGRNTDYWHITEENLHEAERQAEAHGERIQPAGNTADEAMEAGTDSATIGMADDTGLSAVDRTSETSTHIPIDGEAGTNPLTETVDESAPATAGDVTDSQVCPVSGLKLTRAFWTQVVRPMIEAKHPQYAGRIAAGLVGHGSECYGFDDAYSQDHDFGPRCCLWLADEDYAAIGDRLQADYAALPRDFTVDGQGHVTFAATETGGEPVTEATRRFSPVTPRAQGTNRRDGVFRIGDFFTAITGYPAAPAPTAAHEWLMLDEATLAAATNGEVFQDPTGMFSKTRQGFKDMPDDVRLALISKRLGMIAQAGQYNLPRSLKRGDAAAAWLSIREFVNATASLVFLINVPMVVGYMPYYKWQFAALRKMSGSMFALLPGVCGQLETVMRLSSAACYGGAGFGEGGKGSAPAIEQINGIVEEIAQAIVKELLREHLTTSNETFLEWQRPYVEDHIASDDPILKSL